MATSKSGPPQSGTGGVPAGCRTSSASAPIPPRTTPRQPTPAGSTPISRTDTAGRSQAGTRARALARGYDAFGEPAEPGEVDGGGPRDREGRQHAHREPAAPELPRFGYRGELALGSMLYLRARAYDTGLGRFLTRDPAGTPPVPGQVGNPYAYAANDPLNHTDPPGQWPSASCLSHIRRSLAGVRHDVAHYLD